MFVILCAVGPIREVWTMNMFQKQLLLKDDKSMAELDNPARQGVGQLLPPRKVSVTEFEIPDFDDRPWEPTADDDYASTPHPSAHYNGFSDDDDPDLVENVDRFNRL
jgi:hypothetical protein